MRATIIATTDSAGERAVLEAWLLRWEAQLAHLSDELGCGCCVFIRDVDAPAAALAELPSQMVSDSEWSRGAS